MAAIRQRCRQARIIVRGDSGFGREEIMAWCERQEEVYYCLGLAKNSVLIEKLGPALAAARARHCLTGAASVREFTEFEISDAGQLEPGAPSDRQGRGDEGRGKSALCGDQPAGRRVQGRRGREPFQPGPAL